MWRSTSIELIASAKAQTLILTFSLREKRPEHVDVARYARDPRHPSPVTRHPSPVTRHSNLNQPSPKRNQRELRLIVRAEFLFDVIQMRADGGCGEIQIVGDGLNSFAFGES